jgi:hypothetical protein
VGQQPLERVLRHIVHPRRQGPDERENRHDQGEDRHDQQDADERLPPRRPLAQQRLAWRLSPRAHEHEDQPEQERGIRQ